MPVTYNQVSTVEFVETTAAILEAGRRLTEVCQKLKQNEMDSVWAPWTDSTRRSIGVILTLAATASNTIDEQVLSKKTGKPSHLEARKDISAREVAARKKRQTSPPKKRGRPPKKRPS